MKIRIALVVAFLCVLSGFGVTLATPLEERFVALPGWIPGIAGDFSGDNILAEHGIWHGLHFDLPDDFNPANDVQGREFLEFHREFLAQTDDFRIFNEGSGGVAIPVVIPVVAQLNSQIRFGHIGYGCERPDNDTIERSDACHFASSWYARTANLLLGNDVFHGYTVNDLGVNIQTFHNEGHGSIAKHRPVDMQWQRPATKDASFFQWHKNIDNIYSDWVVGQYQGVLRSGKPIFFSVSGTAIGRQATVNALKARRQGPVYQGFNPPRADQYGASSRIASDIYVGDADGKNLLYAAGVRKWNSATDAWDIDAWSILNPSQNGWYFSVTMGSVGLAATAVRTEAVKGGDIFDSTENGTNTLCRSEISLGLEAAVSDELDALEIDRDRRVQGTNDSSLPGVYDRPKQWFSLRAGSTQGVIPFGGVVAVSPNDILRFNQNGELVIDVSEAALGLGPGDDLDALAIVDAGAANPNALGVGDIIYYSLTKGSPKLVAGGATNSAADILCYTMGAGAGGAGGAACAKVAAATIGLVAAPGLATDDDLDALDVRRGACGGGFSAISSSRLQTDPPLPGACCHANTGSCTEVLATACVGPGDTFQGEELSCDAARCPSLPGACCAPTGSCTVVSDRACGDAAGTFRGPGTTCPPVPACTVPPSNDECANAIVIPSNFTSGLEPPANNTNATIPTFLQARDPAYSCKDPRSFSGPYGSGTLWYSYTVNPGAPRSILLSTKRAAQFYPSGGGAGDTRIALYYAPNGNCSVLQEVACADNIVCPDDPATGDPTDLYAPLRYDNPIPGKYYVQLSTTYSVQRGQTYLQVTDPPTLTGAKIPALSPWGLAGLTLLVMGVGAILLRMRGGLAT